jgi:hypothetical protein
MSQGGGGTRPGGRRGGEGGSWLRSAIVVHVATTVAHLPSPDGRFTRGSCAARAPAHVCCCPGDLEDPPEAVAHDWPDDTARRRFLETPHRHPPPPFPPPHQQNGSLSSTSIRIAAPDDRRRRRTAVLIPPPPSRLAASPPQQHVDCHFPF